MVLIVASIDFGTTYSGWAYSSVSDYKKDPTDVKAKHCNSGTFISCKAPTCVLIRADGKTLEAFGFEAENKYAELASKETHQDWYFVTKFKMALFNSEVTIGKDTMVEDVAGKQINAMLVFSLTIKHLHDDLLKTLNTQVTGGINKSDIGWVLTVPAIWDDHAKQFMRIAAREAGIEMGHLNLALEPEAASIFCRHANLHRANASSSEDISTFPPGTRYLVCDAGGGTVDITVHEVTPDMKLKEIEKASGGAWGGSKVDEAFEKFVDTLAGGAAMRALKKESMEDYLEFMRAFELKKRECKQSSDEIVVRFPTALSDIVQDMTGNRLADQIEMSPHKSQVRIARDKLKCDASIIAVLFNETIGCITGNLSTILSKFEANSINHIVMVGGFSESPLLQDAVKSAFPGKHVTIPQDAGLAVMKGAVMFGHNKRQIVSRISRFTYGFGCSQKFNPSIHPAHTEIKTGLFKGCVDKCFAKVVSIGQSIPSDEEAGKDSYDKPLKGCGYYIRLFATTATNPLFVDDTGCFKIGSFYVNCKGNDGHLSGTNVRMCFGGTEIEVKVTLESTGEETTATFDLPE